MARNSKFRQNSIGWVKIHRKFKGKNKGRPAPALIKASTFRIPENPIPAEESCSKRFFAKNFLERREWTGNLEKNRKKHFFFK